MGAVKKIVLLGIALQLTGCAIFEPKDESAEFLKPYQYDNTKSYALNVMKAARLDDGLYDMPRPDDFDSVGPNNGLGSEVIGSVLTAAAWSGLSALGKGVFLGSIGEKRLESDYGHIFAWIPEKTGSSKQEAEKIFFDKLLDATEHYYLDKGYSVRSIKKQHDSISWSTTRFLKGDQCVTKCSKEDKNCKVCYSALIHESDGTKCIPAVTPDFLGGGNSYHTYSRNPYRSFVTLWFQGSGKQQSKLERYLEYSKNLPKWVFLYLPQRWDRKNIEDYPSLPVLINQGKIHYFFIPENR